MSNKKWVVVWLLLSITVTGFSVQAGQNETKADKYPYKVYVILGFHTNFYHSWRGDTPDEAGFGTDIRIVREIIRMLNEANEQGLDARGYWEGENLFTFEDIIPNYAPDIIQGIRRRVDAGLDEVTLAPYSNSMFSAMTERETRSAVKWAISNPWGSGMKDLFGKFQPIIRPQEGMTATGLVPILKDEGVNSIILAYSAYPFTTFTNFVSALPIEQRLNPTYMRMQDGGQKMVLFPCVSIGDVLDFVSLEKWMRDLHRLQMTGKIKRDLVIHINFDADAETWVPLVPKILRWIPNAGGLPEYIRYVNKYDWAEFTTPGEYLATHEPVGEVMIRQDTADGGWDGNYSWAEKFPSHIIWTELEKSRLYTYQAEALMAGVPPGVQAGVLSLLYFGRESSFFHRIRGLSTTHFGMSTPMVNEERQAVAEKVVAEAKDKALQALRAMASEQTVLARLNAPEKGEEIYSFLVQDIRLEDDGRAEKVLNMVRIPVILPGKPSGLVLEDSIDNSIPFSVFNQGPMGDGRMAAELIIPIELDRGESRKLYLKAITLSENKENSIAIGQNYKLANGALEFGLSTTNGVEFLKFQGELMGDRDFLKPFITYRADKSPEQFTPTSYELTVPDVVGSLKGIQAADIITRIKLATPDGDKDAKLYVRFILPDEASWIIADVDVDYPYTNKRDVLNTLQQKLRRYIDLRWIETAPFQLHPLLDATRDEPIRVWKHNYLDVTSYYDLNYGQINPKNAEWDSMNHQVTAGWVAVTDRKKGLMLGQSAEMVTSYAFCSMRLREQNGNQQLWMNPFGSYYGKQQDYTHLGGNGLGGDLAVMAGPSLRSNGPSYNGMHEKFSLLIAPYAGDRPPEKLQAEAEAFFYPPAVVYLTTPDDVNAIIKDEMLAIIDEARLAQSRSSTEPLPVPMAFLANPTGKAVDLVWDEPEDTRIDGYSVQWKPSGSADWNNVDMGKANRYRVSELKNGRSYDFRVKAIGTDKESDWTGTETVKVGPVKTMSPLSAAQKIDFRIIRKVLLNILTHLLTTG